MSDRARILLPPIPRHSLKHPPGCPQHIADAVSGLFRDDLRAGHKFRVHRCASEDLQINVGLPFESSAAAAETSRSAAARSLIPWALIVGAARWLIPSDTVTVAPAQPK